MKQVTNYQGLQPTIPEHWKGDERRFAQELIDVLDGIYHWRGRLAVNDLSSKALDDLIKIVDDRVVIGSAQIDDLETAFAAFFDVKIENAEIKIAQIKELTAEVLSIVGAIESIRVKRLEATSAKLGDITLKVNGYDVPMMVHIGSVIDTAVKDERRKLLFALHEAKVLSDEQLAKVQEIMEVGIIGPDNEGTV